MSGSKNSSAGNGSQFTPGVIRNIEWLCWRLLETKLSAKCHVLDCHERAIRQKNKVKGSVTNDNILGLVDDIAEDSGTRRRRFVAVDKDGAAAGCPCSIEGRVDGLLHVLAVEVDGRTLGEVVETAGETEHIPQERTSRGNLIDIKAGVDFCNGLLDAVREQVVIALGSSFAGFGIDARKRVRKMAASRVVEMFAAGISISALSVDVVDLLGEGVVEREQVAMVVDEGHQGEFGDAVIDNGRIVNEHSLHVEVLLIVGLDHSVGNVRAVHAAMYSGQFYVLPQLKERRSVLRI